MGREIRRVPNKWEHPKINRYKEKDFKPLMDDYVESLSYYKESVDNFIKYMTEVIEKGEVTIYDTKYTVPQEVYNYLIEEITPPDISLYMPSGEWYQLYENVSEGTPLTPPFETKKELVEWLVDNLDYWEHQWTREQAEAIVDSGYAPSGVFSNGKFYTAEESTVLNKK